MKSLSGVGKARRHIARGLALGVVAGSAGLAAGVGSANAASPNIFALQAQADGVYVLVANPRLPAGLPGGISPYGSGASIDSNGNSRAYAGAPYLGPNLQTLPGLVGGLSGSRVPELPELPGFVESQDPGNPRQRTANAGYVLTATSDDLGSEGTVDVGAAGSADGETQFFATSIVSAIDDGSTFASATAGTRLATVGPLTVLDVSSQVSVATNGEGEVTAISNTTNLGTIEVAGIKIGLTESGFTVLSAPIPAPTDAILAAVSTILAAGNTEMALLPSTETVDEETGEIFVQSAALRVTSTQDVPGLGAVDTTFSFGRATVTTANRSLGGDPNPTTSSTSTTGTVDPSTSTTGTVDPSTSTTGTVDPSTSTTGTFDPSTSSSTGTVPDISVDSSTTGTINEIPDLTGPTIGDPTTGTTGGQAPVAKAGGIGNAVVGEKSELLYLVLVLGGGAAFLAQQLFSRFGVQLMLRQG